MSLLFTVLQVLGAAVALLGLWLLAGSAWTALIGGSLLLAVATLAEAAHRRPARAGGE